MIVSFERNGAKDDTQSAAKGNSSIVSALNVEETACKAARAKKIAEMKMMMTNIGWKGSACSSPVSRTRMRCQTQTTSPRRFVGCGPSHTVMSGDVGKDSQSLFLCLQPSVSLTLFYFCDFTCSVNERHQAVQYRCFAAAICMGRPPAVCPR